MALPHERQMIARHIKYRDLTHALVADATEISRVRFGNLVKGNVYPSPDELARIERYFSLPAEVLFDARMLAYRVNWPPPSGAAALKAENERLRAEAGE
jgi:hypothetical protein